HRLETCFGYCSAATSEVRVDRAVARLSFVLLHHRRRAGRNESLVQPGNDVPRGRVRTHGRSEQTLQGLLFPLAKDVAVASVAGLQDTPHGLLHGWSHLDVERQEGDQAVVFDDPGQGLIELFVPPQDRRSACITTGPVSHREDTREEGEVEHVRVEIQAKVEPAAALHQVHLRQHVDLRKLHCGAEGLLTPLTLQHGAERGEQHRDELGRVAAVVRVHQVRGRDSEVARLQVAHNVVHAPVVGVQLHLGAIDEQVVVPEGLQLAREPLQVRLQELHAVDEATVGAQPQRVHHVSKLNQGRNVHARLVRQHVVGWVHVDHGHLAAQRRAELLHRLAVARLARPRRSDDHLAERRRPSSRR
ncbi:unnamed protein product, partial [Ixodes pacificus]